MHANSFSFAFFFLASNLANLNALEKKISSSLCLVKNELFLKKDLQHLFVVVLDRTTLSPGEN